MIKNMCPCGSEKSYEACCEVYHKHLNAPTCEALMRSRYSAFVFSLVDYLFETTHPSYRSKTLKEEIAFTCKGLAWTGLSVLETWQGGLSDKVGKVSFRATFVQEGREGVHVEHSRFKRFGKAWMYVDGKVE
ncbi:YchJ family protein [Sulfurospirillum deleyianum]|uniref:SecC motif-containing protein n=1 Tax=Sulfurospirillum deleyianum (strain ATCC 51133 / DSM 6946 / 5175) TaxID=525898 RepID=D1AZF9_SULD5|nr:YchJ family metal-binding protein [Sulfurospirillum deleyianum]ACZ11426.1 SecC motif-containing protein [Sulfurospirillum deleyianum DSM 6946]